jgi:hypothetical protein
MTIPFTSPFKYIETTHSDEFGIQHHFTADFINQNDFDGNPSTDTLNIIYRPTDTEYQFHIDIDGQHHSDDIDTIDESQYFDDDAIAFFKSFTI